MRTGALTLRLSIFLLLLSVNLGSQEVSLSPEVTSSDLGSILQGLEKVQRQDPAQSRPYEVTRSYKVFQGDEKQPSSTATVLINFVPPATKTYRIAQASGQLRGEKLVRELLDEEVVAAEKNRESEISRANYDFVFLRQDKLGSLDAYVIRIIPKRKERYLFRGQIWVDATEFRIRRLEGVPAKNPSFWVTGVHLTMQFGDVTGMWIPISFDVIASIRYLGRFTISGLNVAACTNVTTDPQH